MFWPGSQKFWRPLPGCGAPFPLAAGSPGCQRFERPLPGFCAPFLSAATGSGSQKFWRPLPGCGVPFPSTLSCSGSQRFGALSRGAAPFPSAAPARTAGRSQEVFRQEPGPVCRVGGGGFSGAEFAPFPSPFLLPPAGMGRLFSGVSQSLCFANCRRCVPAG